MVIEAVVKLQNTSPIFYLLRKIVIAIIEFHLGLMVSVPVLFVKRFFVYGKQYY